jgi:glutamyl-tRNA synthetase
MERLAAEFAGLPVHAKEAYEETLHHTAASLGISNGELIHPLRLAVSGMSIGPGLFDILFILGKDETIRRITTAIGKLS